MRPTSRIDVRRAADRLVTRADGLRSAHSFSFGRHYDAQNVAHGVLLAHNDEVVAAGAGFGLHPHRDLEIVTWVLEGTLVHEDSTGHSGVVYPGLAQRMSAGRGIVHAERNDGAHRGDDRPPVPVRFVQMWVVPDAPGGDPGYDQREIADLALRAALVPVASGLAGHGDAAVRLANRSAALHAARLQAGESVELPDAPFLHVFAARGAMTLEAAGPLAEADAARITGGGGHRVTATEAAEVLVWEMHASL